MDNNSENKSKYDLIKGGVANLEMKWGPHIDEVQRQLKDGRMTKEQAEELKGGWSVSGQGGPEIPFDAESGIYQNKGKWYQTVQL